jgi:hypothetical protein
MNIFFLRNRPNLAVLFKYLLTPFKIVYLFATAPGFPGSCCYYGLISYSSKLLHAFPGKMLFLH